ncbi:cyclic nucleotide-binding domain-containing protein [Actinomadura alba]|uniref:Cyclic nucleotide-binding domain-containing protein n=1 Tax=Actinomadura alba TaxID=406431 RepID=A0ABR7LW02_9ACTN|nr:cyclic nucleotide-binding domain-containing protein [Actinomadura alba]MBC6468858.1 cyclic nucleotide-binding domain-containing protein [Actinomadura alba]
MSYRNHALHRLLIAFSDASAAFEMSRAAPPSLRAGSVRRLLEAFSGATPGIGSIGSHTRTRVLTKQPTAAAGVVTVPTPAQWDKVQVPSLTRGTVAGLLGFSVLGAACTTWAAIATSAGGAGVVAALTFAVPALFLTPIVQYARGQAALTRAGLAFAGTVDDVRALKASDAAVFARLLGHSQSPRSRGTTPARHPDEFRESFWNALEPAERRHLHEIAQERVFAAGVPLLRQGYPADYVVIIRSGWTKVRVDRAGEERIVAVRGPGDLVGERALLRDGAWSATVIALDAVDALVIAAEDFSALVSRYPGVLSVLEKQVHDRIAEEPTLSTPNELIDTEQRLAALITALGGAQPTTLPVTGHELAGWTSSSPAVVGSVLTSWRDQGIVRTNTDAIDVLDPGQLERLTDNPPIPSETAAASPFWTGQNCTIMFLDIAGFGAPTRTETDRRVIRTVLYEVLQQAFDDAAVSWAACHREDRGDGVLIVIPPGISTNVVLDSLIPQFSAGMGRHNRQAGEAQRFQVRVAVHVGPVVADTLGVSGSALIQAARLLDSLELKRRLAAGGADLGLIVSASVYETVVGPAADFERVRVSAKETSTTAWMRLVPP